MTQAAFLLRLCALLVLQLMTSACGEVFSDRDQQGAPVATVATGRLLDAQGNPRAGTLLSLHVYESAVGFETPAVGGFTQTRANGTFSLKAPRTPQMTDLQAKNGKVGFVVQVTCFYGRAPAPVVFGARYVDGRWVDADTEQPVFLAEFDYENAGECEGPGLPFSLPD
jgi:hypothetical protein